MPGGHSGEVIPVPIPNTEVKLSYADDTAAKWESRQLPGFFYFKVSLRVEAFFVLKAFIFCKVYESVFGDKPSPDWKGAKGVKKLQFFMDEI